jgi:hypothetical protein
LSSSLHSPVVVATSIFAAIESVVGIVRLLSAGGGLPSSRLS